VRVVAEDTLTLPVNPETPETVKRFEGPNPRILVTGSATLLKKIEVPPVLTTFCETDVGTVVGYEPDPIKVTFEPEILETFIEPKEVIPDENTTF
jgi:hypothetical protein